MSECPTGRSPGTDNLRLTGRCVVVTRPRDQSKELCDRLRELSAEVVEFPTIKIIPANDQAPLQTALDHIRQYDWILFTSSNAVAVVARVLKGDPAAALGKIRIAAVGEATRRSIAALVVEPSFVPSQFNMASLCDELIEAENVRGTRFLYPCGDLADPGGPQALRDAGAIVDAVPAYRTIPDNTADADGLRTRLHNREIDAIIFASPSAVKSFVARIDLKHLSEHVALVSIGSKTARALAELTEGRIVEAGQASLAGIIDAVVRAVR